VALSVIGAGFGRTGTFSLRVALGQLGFGPCHHMAEIFANPSQLPLWEAAARGEAVDWDTVLAGYRATVDWPAAAFWRELVEESPDAKVLLSLRDADRWYDSVRDTIYHTLTRELPDEVPETLRAFHAMIRELIFDRTFGGRLGDREHAKRVFEAHNQAVVDAIPPSKLLVYHPGDGWEPLCRFLDVPVPGEPFPHLNDTAEFRARIGLPPVDAAG
jgi:hypothetical protein